LEEGSAPQAERSSAVMTLNVTVLTKDRLCRAMDAAELTHCDFICLQKTRRPEGGFRWAGRDAASRRWFVQWSRTSPIDRLGRQSQGGTALLWRMGRGKGKPLTPSSHRWTRVE